MNRKVLLLEPNYKNKFPPIGLMKLATYFKLRGDDVVFYKGDLKEFVLHDIAEDCVNKLTSIDGTIDWRLSADKIVKYIKYRKKSYLNQIGMDNSKYAIFLYSWLENYKNQYHKGTWKQHPKWDWVGVTTLFTFYWDITVETINFAKLLVKDPKNLMVGGVLASIQPKELEEATGIKPHVGILGTSIYNAKNGQVPDIDPDNEYVIDSLPLDYSILDEINYKYSDNNAYFSYSTRGCIRRCPFCAVPILEPTYSAYLPLYERINQTRRYFGEQQNLLLMDNNVLASKRLSDIIEDIKSCGFTKGSKFQEQNLYNLTIRNLRIHLNDRAYTRKGFHLLEKLNTSKRLTLEEKETIYRLREEHGLLALETCTRDALIKTYRLFRPYFDKTETKSNNGGRLRYVDFNQGVDARLFNEKRVALLSEIPIKPLRIAFDNIKTEPEYTKAIKLSVSKGMRDFSNYLLYNFDDEPIDLYRRLRINIDLCEQLDVSIYSFPMKYHPIRNEHSHDRDYIGEHWNRKYIRAVQAILNATKGKIGRGVSFFEKAFGKTEEEYMELLIMPETFLIYRFFFEHLGYTQEWQVAYRDLNEAEHTEILPIIYRNEFNHIESLTDNPRLLNVLKYYRNYRKEIADHKSELYKQKKEFESKSIRLLYGVNWK
ncbi:MAG: hypothetical protein IKG81_12100 [Bacteroidales bacterium]|nr:hypothetical protein [Bacteroidales bacterium]